MVLKNDPTTRSSLKVDLKFSTLAPSIDNKYKIENGQKLLIKKDLDTRNTNIGFKNELTTRYSLKVDLKFSTLAPSFVKFQVA